MQSTSKGLRLHIGIFGRRNAGKSSLLNAITRQEVSIVSDLAGTTTDPVEKPMELLPLGPVLFIDTAGIDDEGALGEMRVKKTRQVFDRTDLALIVAQADSWGDFEEQLIEEFRNRRIPTIVAVNKVDLYPLDEDQRQSLDQKASRMVEISATQGTGLLDLRQALLDLAPQDFLSAESLISDLVPEGGLVVLVVPIDKEAPKGRLILPQVQAIRDLLDHDQMCIVVKDRDLRTALQRLSTPPDLVVTDSQAFLKVSADVPGPIPLTGFSVLFSRYKGDLSIQVEGALAVDQLRAGDRILVAEACSHHPIGEDIGRVKIPMWLNKYVGGKLEYDHVQGHDFPEDLSSYSLVIHCGACMLNRREMLNRLFQCSRSGVPATNYGLVIAYSLGVFERALQPFPAALDIYRQHLTRNQKSILNVS